jgi:hypothetical protein
VRVGASIGIYSFLKVARLVRLRAAPPSIRTCYILMLAMVGETISRSCPSPTMLLGQSKASKLIDVSIHLWCGMALGAGEATATSRHRVLTMRQDVMS